jgi:hypothetical protein
LSTLYMIIWRWHTMTGLDASTWFSWCKFEQNWKPLTTQQGTRLRTQQPDSTRTATELARWPCNHAYAMRPHFRVLHGHCLEYGSSWCWTCWNVSRRHNPQGRDCEYFLGITGIKCAETTCLASGNS